MALGALPGVVIRPGVTPSTVGVAAVVEPIGNPGIGAVALEALPGIMSSRGLIGVARDAIKGCRVFTVVEFGDGPAVHSMAFDTRRPLFRGRVIFGREVTSLTIGVLGMVEGDLLPIRDAVAA